jgi:hypothetical protein
MSYAAEEAIGIWMNEWREVWETLFFFCKECSIWGLSYVMLYFAPSSPPSSAKQPFLSHSLPKKILPGLSWLDQQVFTSLDFATLIFFLQSMVVSLASNPQTGGPGFCSYVPRLEDGPVIAPGTGFPFRRLLRLAELRWRYSNRPPHGGFRLILVTIKLVKQLLV